MIGGTWNLLSHFRLGVSDGASPSLSGSIGEIHNHPFVFFIIITIVISGSTDPEPILDPQAIYMIPQEWGRAEVGQH